VDINVQIMVILDKLQIQSVNQITIILIIELMILKIVLNLGNPDKCLFYFVISLLFYPVIYLININKKKRFLNSESKN